MKLLIKTEFRRNFKSLMLWTAIVSGFSLMMLLLFPAFEETLQSLGEMMSAYPDAFLEVFGMGEGQLDMSEIYGWFGIEGYLFVTLIGGSYTAILGSSILSKEEDDKTIEFLLSRPISRSKILFGKAVVVFVNLVILNSILGIILLLAFSIFADFLPITWALYVVGPFILQLIFASIALMISVFIVKPRIVMSASLGLVVGMYAIDIVAKISDKLEFLKYITPYEYVNALSIVRDNEIKPLYLLFSLIIIVISFSVTYKVYCKKDISV